MIYNTEFIKEIAVFTGRTTANYQAELFVIVRLAVLVV